jgi:hypothetical protein
MKFIPILMKDFLIRAVIDDLKSETRRKIKPNAYQSVWADSSLLKSCTVKFSDGVAKFSFTDGWHFLSIKCPYGKIGDTLWVKETYCKIGFDKPVYKADYGGTTLDYFKRMGKKWCSAMLMPKTHCRLWLKITNVRVERLSDINEQSAVDEGVEGLFERFKNYENNKLVAYSAKESFTTLWNFIAKRPNAFDEDPWVWVIEFEKIFEMPEGFLD